MVATDKIKRVVYLSVKHCVGCMLTNPRILELEKKVFVQRMDGNIHKKICEEHDISFFPAIIMYDEDNNVIDKIVGPRSIDYAMKTIFNINLGWKK